MFTHVGFYSFDPSLKPGVRFDRVGQVEGNVRQNGHCFMCVFRHSKSAVGLRFESRVLTAEVKGYETASHDVQWRCASSRTAVTIRVAAGNVLYL